MKEDGKQQELLMFDTVSNSSKPSNDEKLYKAFQAFRQAVIKSDFTSLKALSSNCISCGGFDRLVSIDSFYSKHFSTFFDSVLLTRINDARINGHYNTANWHIYSQPCLRQSSDLENPHIAEIAIVILDRSNDTEGGSAMLAFIETKSTYKFCGYSTMP